MKCYVTYENFIESVIDRFTFRFCESKLQAQKSDYPCNER